MAPPTKKPSKPVFKTSSPFTETRWPSVAHEDNEVITELLCNLLVPLGEHRKTHIQPSKGKKRKRGAKSTLDDASKPPIPTIRSHVLIGLNSVTRHLETLAASTAPPSVPINEPSMDEENLLPTPDKGTGHRSQSSAMSLSLVVLTHPQPSLSPSHAHIPTLLHLATLRHQSGGKSPEPTRLICLPTSHDARIASALQIPRVGAIGVYSDAPGATALEQYVREHVGLTDCAWVNEALRAEWRGMNVRQD